MESHNQYLGEGSLIGHEAISRYLGICSSTVWNWRRRHAFPITNLPDGRVMTTKSLIDQWVLSRPAYTGTLNQSPGRPRTITTKYQAVTDDSSCDRGQAVDKSE